MRTLLFFLLLIPSVALADLVEEEPTYPDNTGAINDGDGHATSILEDGGAGMGTIEDKITLHSIESGVEVYSSHAKVEVINTDSDGWVGKIETIGGGLRFTPNGRPALNCPEQEELDGWYGPCQIQEQQG